MWTQVAHDVAAFVLLLITPLAAHDPFGDPPSAPEVAAAEDTSASETDTTGGQQNKVAPSTTDDLLSAPDGNGGQPGTSFEASTDHDSRAEAPMQRTAQEWNEMAVKVFTLKNIDPVEVKKTLQAIFGDDNRFAVYTMNNAIVAAGTPEHLAYVEALLIKLDSTESAKGSNAWTAGRPWPNAADKWEAKVFNIEGIALLRQEYESAERSALQIADEYRQAKNDSASANELSALRERLHSAVQQAFDARQKLQSAEAQSLRERIQAIGNRIQQRQQLRDRIIARRVEDLIADIDLNWNAGPSDGKEESPWPSDVRHVGPEGDPF